MVFGSDDQSSSVYRFKQACTLFCKNRKVELRNLGLGPSFAKELACILSVNPNIAQLNLENNNLNNEGIKMLCRKLETYESICHLDIGGNGIN